MKKEKKGNLRLILNAVALAMGIVILVLCKVQACPDPATMLPMLGIGMVCLALSAMIKQEEEGKESDAS